MSYTGIIVGSIVFLILGTSGYIAAYVKIG